MEAGPLLSTCVAVVRSFDPAVASVDSHVDEKLDELRVAGEDRAFVQQVAYGIFRMERPLRAFLNAFYHVHAVSLNRGDFHLYQVLSYVALFRLGEVAFSRFLGLLASQVGSSPVRPLPPGAHCLSSPRARRTSRRCTPSWPSFLTRHSWATG